MLYKGFFFGLTLQLALGPVFFTLLNISLRQGLPAALAMVGGVALADALYIVMSFTGISHLLTVPVIKPIIAYLAATLLLVFGLSYFRCARPLSVSLGTQPNETKGYYFFYGLRLTLANPLTIVFWSCTFSALIVSQGMTQLDLVLYAFGCILSTLTFLAVTSLLGRFLSQLLKPRLLTLLNYLVGLFLIGFACRIILSL